MRSGRLRRAGRRYAWGPRVSVRALTRAAWSAVTPPAAPPVGSYVRRTSHAVPTPCSTYISPSSTPVTALKPDAIQPSPLAHHPRLLCPTTRCPAVTMVRFRRGTFASDCDDGAVRAELQSINALAGLPHAPAIPGSPKSPPSLRQPHLPQTPHVPMLPHLPHIVSHPPHSPLLVHPAAPVSPPQHYAPSAQHQLPPVPSPSAPSSQPQAHAFRFLASSLVRCGIIPFVDPSSIPPAARPCRGC